MSVLMYQQEFSCMEEEQELFVPQNNSQTPVFGIHIICKERVYI